MGRIAALIVAALLGGPPAETVREIASLGPRPAGSSAERAAARIVERELRAAGYRVLRQRVELPRGGTSVNVVAVPRGPIRAVVTAHLDGVSEGPAANDNASGVAVLLDAARRLRKTDGILFAALGAEERVETGSRLHLGAMRLVRGFSAAGKRRIRVALNLDMVGVGTRFYVRGIEAAPNRSARLVLAAAPGMRYLRDPGHSDHAELSRHGIPAAWLQWREDACWHRPCDTAARVDPRKLVATSRLAVAVLRAALESS